LYVRNKTLKTKDIKQSRFRETFLFGHIRVSTITVGAVRYEFSERLKVLVWYILITNREV
jgi:hypothetical protein